MSDVTSLMQKRDRLIGAAQAKSGNEAKNSVVEKRDPFACDENGVWYFGRDRDGNPKPSEWICSPLKVLAKSRPCDGVDWSYVLQFSDPEKHAREWIMPARMLAGDGNELRAALLAQGLSIAPRPQVRARLSEYIQTRSTDAIWRHTDRVGWHGSTFVLPDRTIGAGEDRILFQSDGLSANAYRQKGTLDDWRDNVARLCAGNSRLVFSVSAAFAGVLLDLVGVDSGGFHWRGDSSSGKTTGQRVASSVWGGADYMQRWRTTDNAIESLAAQHSDTFLALDEIAQVDPAKVGECAYTLANGAGKVRAKQSGALRPRLQWRILFLSSGEISLADRAAEVGARIHTGQEIRMIDLAADAGAGFGAFETLHDYAQSGSAAFADALAKRASESYGVAGVTFIERLCVDRDTFAVRLRSTTEALTKEWVQQGSSGQVSRVARRFACVAAAGELATEFGITGWQTNEATVCAQTIFNEWIEARGGVGTGESARMLAQVRGFLAQHGASRFTDWHRATDDHAPNTINRAGFRRLFGSDGKPIEIGEGGMIEKQNREAGAYEYFILQDVFRKEVCMGFDHKAVCRLLKHHGHLHTEGERFDRRERLPQLGATRCYRIRASIFADSEA
jgi:putative DNA primase/helicase